MDPLRSLIFDGTPDWATGMTGIATLVLACAAVVTLIVVAWQLDDSRKTRNGALVADLARRWTEPAAIRAQKLYARYGSAGIIALTNRLYSSHEYPGGADDADFRADLDLLYQLLAWPELIETIGVLHDDDVLTTDVVYKMWGSQIIDAWGKWHQPVMTMRAFEDQPKIFSNFEKLASDLKSRVAADAERAAVV